MVVIKINKINKKEHLKNGRQLVIFSLCLIKNIVYS